MTDPRAWNGDPACTCGATPHIGCQVHDEDYPANTKERQGVMTDYKMVPREPTPETLAKAVEAVRGYVVGGAAYRMVAELYDIFTAAAPQQQAEPVAWRYRVSMRGHERNQWQYTNGPQRPLPPASADDRHRIIEVEPLYASPRITDEQTAEPVTLASSERAVMDSALRRSSKVVGRGITDEKVEELKRLANELTQSAVDVAVAECAVMMVDPGIKYKRQKVDEDRAALYAALDALVKE